MRGDDAAPVCDLEKTAREGDLDDLACEVAASQVAEALEVDPPRRVDPAGDTRNGLVLRCGRGVLGLDELEGRLRSEGEALGRRAVADRLVRADGVVR
jgi:hypothetical protein